MRRVRIAAASLAVLAAAVTLGVSHSGPGPAAENRYVGADKCKNCHAKDEAGNPHKAWMESKHAKAFESLASDHAKTIAMERGIADPQKSDQCVRCHVTAFGVAAEKLKKGFLPAGVQCEVCHGPGEEHMKARLLAAGSGSAPGALQVLPEGEVTMPKTAELCLQCHNKESPTFKDFCFKKRLTEIRHLDPRKPRTEQEKAIPCGCPECQKS